MNKQLVRLFLGAALVCNADAAFSKPEVFSCERIKEKSVRSACIKDREAKEQAENEEKSRAALAEKEREAAREKELKEAAEKARASDEFVNKSKQLLVQNLKDPDSAKFTNLVIAQTGNGKLLCGSMNAKNSYGGYVGAKRFYVLWDASAPDKPEVYTEGDETARASARMDELLAITRSRSASLSAKIDAAQEGDRVMARARSELARSSKILTEQCMASANTTVAVVEK
jgi:hypothetical protein